MRKTAHFSGVKGGAMGAPCGSTASRSVSPRHNHWGYCPELVYGIGLSGGLVIGPTANVAYHVVENTIRRCKHRSRIDIDRASSGEGCHVGGSEVRSGHESGKTGRDRKYDR